MVQESQVSFVRPLSGRGGAWVWGAFRAGRGGLDALGLRDWLLEGTGFGQAGPTQNHVMDDSSAQPW